MKSRWMVGACACGLLLAVAACSRQEHAADGVASEAAVTQSAPVADEAAGAAATSADTESQLESAALTQDDGPRRFIRTARIEFRVADVYRSTRTIEDLTQRLGGYVASNDTRNETDDVRHRNDGDGWNVQLTSYVTRADLSVRVPSERAQDFVRMLSNQVVFLDRRTFAAVDAQLQLLRQQLAYTRQQQAQQSLQQVAADPGKTGERVGAVQARADALAQRDEAMLARREFEDRVAFATIDLSMYQTPRITRTVRPDLEHAMQRDRPNFFARLGQSFATGWSGLLTVVVALAALWPLWLALVLLGLGVRCWRQRVRRSAAK